MIEQFIASLKKSDGLKEQIVHHEIFPSSPARYGNPIPSLSQELKKALEQLGIHRLYSHQAEAVTKINEGKNVLVTTPTASGKTLTYNIPVFESILNDPQTKAFYIFPMKALERDQLKSIRELASQFQEKKIRAEVYDGDTTSHFKTKIKNDPPHIIITNPDMFHSGFLPYHANWAGFFRNLKYIIIDELHTYRGIFGSHIAQVIRRINRIAEHYGSKPQYIACSATIANPLDFSRDLTGLSFEVIEETGAPHPGRHFLFMNPLVSPYTETVKIIKKSFENNLKVIAFTKSRKITELIHSWLIEQNRGLAPFVSSYRAGFLPEERRDIENKLFKGEIKSVISTSALEVGIDIGGLDICILVGYPGTIINTWQRGGRAGRGKRPALIIFMAQPDALDQFFMKNPSDFFKRNYEMAVLDPNNEPILEGHLPCAAAELPLSEKENYFTSPQIAPILKKLTQNGTLLQAEQGNSYFSARRNPQRFVDIRSIGKSYTILEKGTKKVIGKVAGGKAYSECHEGAVYLHRATQYLIDSIDLKFNNIFAHKVDVSYYTKSKTEKETEILEVTGSKPVGNFIIRKGRIKVTEKVVGFEKRRINGQDKLSTHLLDLPPTIYETVGFWIEIEKIIESSIIMMGLHFMGGIHAIEHAAISLFPLFSLCDRNDIGGISTTLHPQIKKAAVFIYDGHPGGVGLCERGFEMIEELLTATLNLVSQCECESGCPSCIHSPKCGSGNKPLDKQASIETLSQLLAIKPLSERCNPNEENGTDIIEIKKEKEIKPLQKRVCYFDLETQRGAHEVGGWKNTHLMRMSVGIVYDSVDEKNYTYFEKETDQLIKKLKSADLVVGFNIIKFDYSVLKPYTIEDLTKIKTFDMLTDIHSKLSYRLSLNHLAEHTLKSAKTADGLQALKWFKEGKLDKIALYCQKDVEITRDLFLFGMEKGYVLFEKKGMGRMKLPVDWDVEHLILNPS